MHMVPYFLKPFLSFTQQFQPIIQNMMQDKLRLELKTTSNSKHLSVQPEDIHTALCFLCCSSV